MSDILRNIHQVENKNFSLLFSVNRVENDEIYRITLQEESTISDTETLDLEEEPVVSNNLPLTSKVCKKLSRAPKRMLHCRSEIKD